MSVAADLTIAPIFAGGLAAMAVAAPPHYAELVTLLALMVGAILVAVGLLRAGWLATLLSIPVTTGFLAGIAIHIIVGELPTCSAYPRSRGIFCCACSTSLAVWRRPIPIRSRSASACWSSPWARPRSAPEFQEH